MSLDRSILTGFGVSDKDVQRFASSNVGLHGVDISRMSRFLLVQLTSAWKHRTMSTFAVTDVLQSLEGPRPSRNSAKPRPFKGSALSGLWKVHFVDARFLLRNIYNERGMFSEQSNKFAELCKRVSAEEQQAPSPHRWQGRLAYEFVVVGYEKKARKRKLTGEWLIFGIHRQKNIYLALSRHSSDPEQDRSIYNAVRELCGAEFPELFASDAQQGASADSSAAASGRPAAELVR